MSTPVCVLQPAARAAASKGVTSGWVMTSPTNIEVSNAATSSGSFIQDEGLRQYVRSLTVEAQAAPVWDGAVPVKPADLH